MENNKPLIEVRHLQVDYDTVRALDDVSLTIYADDFLGIIGPNGGGKTTLVKTLLGLIKPTAGAVKYIGADGGEVDSLRAGYLPQYSAFDFSFPITVKEVVRSGLLGSKGLFHRFTQVEKRKADETLALLNITELANRSMGELSGGQRQRVLLGRALVSDPQILFLDEPSTYVDKGSETQMYELLHDLNARCAIVLVSHDVGTVVRTVRNIACVNRTLHYHPAQEAVDDWFEHEVGCSFELVAHGEVPHRVLSQHKHCSCHK